ncbi:SDR family oxidoreductase [Anaeromyxobacter oryzae]|uniref:3-beta hydroxysteroid dehydrogenase n=1 Tax=Anaeromyxobacter oryzae TaxID=2918170 RepID=A0ABN6MZK0_9BACT|nr:SDR family oxidoreductase [Anaeromyxobacter oryzae]BDG06091.1 3-beta hydroxysteroid dehydrogenase [Anaeromyxobacter oryzae]
MATVFFTGFPGFLGMELLPRVLERRPADTAVCLVQPKFADLARRRVESLAAARPLTAGRIRLVEGDIARSGLGLDGAALAPGDVVEIHHLAAIYDLSVPRAPAMKVNVEGTRNVLDLAERCDRLERLHYVSTCYVAGRHPGVFLEEDLEKGQAFNNYYEETKYLAEVEVRARMRAGLPATIYRPAIVVGDSRTGETQKYDGPYYVIQWLLRQPGPVAVMPTIGDLTAELNVVPRDFVIAAVAHLSGLAASKGKTYQLADPAPMQVRPMLHVLGRAAHKRLVHVPLPLGLAKWAVDRVPGVYPLLRIPSAALDYFVLPTRWDTRNVAADLAGSGIICPPFASYVDRLVAFARAHPEVGAAAMA